MSIKYNTIQRGEPGVAGGGQKKFYAQVVTDGEVNVNQLVKLIEKFSALSEPDIRGVIIALLNVIVEQITDGKIVRLEELGSLYAGISSEGVATGEEVTSAVIRKAHVIFRPGKRINDALKTAQFQKVK